MNNLEELFINNGTGTDNGGNPGGEGGNPPGGEGGETFEMYVRRRLSELSARIDTLEGK